MSLQATGQMWLVNESEQPEQTLVIKSTTDYDMFRFEHANRPVDPKHVTALVAAIKEKNLLREYPIVVDVNFNVLDGQHRLTAARELNVPIFFIVSKEATVADVSFITSHVDHWDISDHLHFWCMKGNHDYTKLREFHQKYPFLSVSICRYLLSGGRKDTVDFRSGDFRINRMEVAEKTAQAMIDFQRYCDLHKSFQFANAVSVLVSHPKYSHKRMLMKLEYLSQKLVKRVDTKAYVETLSEIYNYKVRVDDIVDFKPQASVNRRIRTKGQPHADRSKKVSG